MKITKSLIGAILGLLSVSFSYASVFPEKVVVEPIKGAKKRNVVFILTDDHRYDAMGFMGHPFMQTPNLDSIANEGVHLKKRFCYHFIMFPQSSIYLNWFVYSQTQGD